MRMIRNPRPSLVTCAVAAFFVAMLCSRALHAYSVLTHEEIVDLAWTSDIQPLLLQRFPGLTEDQLTEAHAYAYGGSVIQDLGYYPFGSRDFSDLVHYVRSGDFVLELIHQSQDADEYAFALGALSHYAADIAGHPAVNEAVSLRYPKLRAKYGKSVRYAQGPTAHLKTEFGFDTLQVAKNRYASDQYHDFIGFQVSQPLLARTFPVIYGLQLKDVLPREELAIGSYRYSVAHLIPQMTKVALRTHKKELIQETPNFAKKRFLYRLSRSDYERQWGKTYTKPRLGTRILAALFWYLPKVGPLKGMGFDNPTPKTEDLYIKSINATVDRYRVLLGELRRGTLTLSNYDLDDGKLTQPAEYSLADQEYARLISKVAARRFDQMTPALRANLLDFYSDPELPIYTRKNPEQWQAVLASVNQLKNAALTSTDVPLPMTR